MESCTVGSKSHSKPQFRQQSASRVSEYCLRATSCGSLASSTNTTRLWAQILSLVELAVPFRKRSFPQQSLRSLSLSASAILHQPSNSQTPAN
jgi:hypothetical protein